jgi:hypothetical protein
MQNSSSETIGWRKGVPAKSGTLAIPQYANSQAPTALEPRIRLADQLIVS